MMKLDAIRKSVNDAKAAIDDVMNVPLPEESMFAEDDTVSISFAVRRRNDIAGKRARLCVDEIDAILKEA